MQFHGRYKSLRDICYHTTAHDDSFPLSSPHRATVRYLFSRQNNLDNLGSLMQDVSLKVTKWEETEESIKTKWRFRCVLGLPWKPTLAAAGVS